MPQDRRKPSQIDQIVAGASDQLLDEEADRQGVPREFARKIAGIESSGRADVISGQRRSSAGAIGKMQLMPGTARDLGVDPNHLEENVRGGVKYLRQQLDAFGGDQRKAAAAYNAGPGAVRKYGGVPPYAETQKYADQFPSGEESEIDRIVRGVGAQLPASSEPNAPTIRKVIPPGRQRTTVRGPVLPSRPASPFSISSPTGFEQAGQRAAVRAAQVSPEVATEADRRGRELTRFQGRSRLGQVGEVAAGGLMQGVDQLVKAASYANPSPMGRRGVSMFTPEAQRNLEAQQAAQDVALPNTAPIVRGVASAASQIPAVALAGPGAPIVAGGIQAANADWRDPKRAALQTGIGLVGGVAGGKLAQMAIRPATMGGRLASGVAGGAAGNVIPSAVEQMAYDGRLNPQQLAQQAVIGGVTGAVLPPGADPRLRRGGDVESRSVTPDQVFAYDENGNPRVDVDAPLTPELVGQGVNRAGDLGATGMRRQNPVQFGQRRVPYRGGPGRGTRPMTSGERVQDRVGSALQDRVAAVEDQRRYDELANRLPEGWGQGPRLPESAIVRSPSNPLAILQENAIEARNNAVQFEDQGDLMAAWREYDVVHKTLVDAQRQMGRPKTPEQADALTAIRREISAAAAQRDRAKKAAMAAQRESSAGQRQAQVAKAALENAPTADLPPETSPLLKSVVNPEGGIPPAGESPSGLFGQLARVSQNLQPKPEVSRATPPTVLEQARRAGGSTDDLAVLDALAKRQAVERPRPAGERTVFGEPGQGGLSLSPYADLVGRNREAVEQLRGMDLESPEAGEIIARIDDDAARRGIELRHIENLLNALRGEQMDAARRADQGVGSAPLRRTTTGELRDFSARADEMPAPSEPLRSAKREPIQVRQEPLVRPAPRMEIGIASVRADEIAGDLRQLHAMNPAEVDETLRRAEARRNDDIRNPQMNEVERRMNRDLLKLANERRSELVKAKRLPPKVERRPGRGENDVTLMDDATLANRIADAERTLDNPRLSEVRAQQLEDFLTVAEKERDARAAKARTVSHPDPAIDGKPVIAETADGRVIVPNKENKTGVSVVKDRSDVSRQRENSIYESRLANAEALERRYLDELDELDEQISLAERDRLDTDEIERLYQQQAVLEEKLEGARQVVNKIINESPDVLEKKHAQSINLTAEALRIKPRVLDGAPVSLTELRSAVGPRMSKLEFDQAVAALAQQGHWTISRLVHPGHMTDAELDALVKIGDDYYIGATLRGSQSSLKPKFIEDAEKYLSDESKNRSEASQVRGNQPPPMPARVTARDLAENVRAEYRPAKNRPGTIYLNDWGLEALNAAHSIEFADASGSDRITSGVNYKPEQARILAEHIRERAARPNFSDEGRKNLLTMARQIELAADDGAVSFVPMLGQGIARAKTTIRHEAFHAQQSSVSPQIHDLTTPRWLPAQKFGAAIADRLGKLGYEKREFPAEAAAFVASGDWGRFGMSRDDARQFLADYFDDVAYRHGKDAINKFRAVHPALQEVVEVRRGTNQPRFGNVVAGLGRSAESAVSRQRGGERSGIRVGGSSGGVPGGDARPVRGQSQTASLRAITPESLRAGQSAPEPTPAQGRPRQGLAGIRAESLRAEGGQSAEPTPAQGRSRQGGLAGIRAEDLRAASSGAAVDKPAGFWAKASEFRKAGLLSGPKTHIVNMLGSTAFQVTEEISRIPAGIADMVISAATGRRTIAGANLAAVTRSSYKAATDGVREAAQIIRRGVPKETAERLQLDESKFENPILRAYTQTVFRALGAEDQIFKTYALTRSLESQAKAAALNDVRAGRIGRGDVKSRMEFYRDNPTNEMSANAIADAEVATFQNENKLSSAIRAGRGQIGEFGNFALDLVLPFDRTPTNIIARTLEMTPLGFGKNAKQLAEAVSKKAFTEDQQRAFVQTFGRAAMGSGLIYLGYALAAQGLMNGLPESDPKKRAKQAAIAPPASIRIGDRWYQVGKLAPAGTLMALGATIHRDSKAGKSTGAIALSGATGMARIALELPHLKVAKEISDLSRTETIPGKAGRMLGSFIPTIISNVGDLTDPYQRESKTFLGGLGSRVPGARRLLPVRRGARGRPIRTEKTDVIDPFGSRPVRP